MLILEDTSDRKIKFKSAIEAQDYIEDRHAAEGSFDWISQITDEKSNHYGCSWKVEIVEI